MGRYGAEVGRDEMSHWPPLTMSRLRATKAVQKTTRKPKTARVARTRAGGEWSEAQFWGFLRSGLRQLSRRWPPLVRHVWLESKQPYIGPNTRAKWAYQCAQCRSWGMRKEMQADHIVPCGTLKSFDDLAGFTERLFVEQDGLQILCERCHQARTNGKGD